MTDILTREQRSYNMSRIRDRNTRPEMIVRSMVHRMGYRYALHKKDLLGKPDLVFVRHRKIIEVRGCFWHMHSCKYGKVVPATRAEFWQKKRQGNVARDIKTLRQLKALGFKVLIVWECQTRNPESLKKKLTHFLES